MAEKYVIIDRCTPMFFPPDLRDWLPEDHMVHFILEAVEKMPMEKFKVNRRGSGSPQYPPSFMLALLIYCYATGRFGSRVIEEASYYDVAVRYICGGEHHPDHDTICTFRRENREAFEACFVKVLAIAQEMGKLKKVGTISIDGTKIHANASKHAAVSYGHAQKQIELLEKEVKDLTAKAEEADNKPLAEGLSLPEEISRRENRKKKLEEASRIIEERFAADQQRKQQEYEEKVARRERQKESGKKPRGKSPTKPENKVPDKNQYNFTDPESRIMKGGSGGHFEQAYNAQASVEVESMLIVDKYATDKVNDKQELGRNVVGTNSSGVFMAEKALADSGYYSEKEVTQVEESGVEAYIAMGKESHHKSVADLEQKPEEILDDNADTKERMRHRLKSKDGCELYKLRKQTVEPVFGIIKQAMGFRQFSLRGKEKANTEWTIVCTAYNLKRLFNLKNTGTTMPANPIRA